MGSTAVIIPMQVHLFACALSPVGLGYISAEFFFAWRSTECVYAWVWELWVPHCWRRVRRPSCCPCALSPQGIAFPFFGISFRFAIYCCYWVCVYVRGWLWPRSLPFSFVVACCGRGKENHLLFCLPCARFVCDSVCDLRCSLPFIRFPVLFGGNFLLWFHVPCACTCVTVYAIAG